MIYRESHLEFHDDPALPARGRFLIVGDVHGQMEMLMRLVRLTGYDPFKDRMIALGDLVDRGPGSAEVLRWFAGGTLRTSLLGNHEALLLDSEFVRDAHKIWMQNGGRWSEQHDPFDLNLLRRLAIGFPLTIRLKLADGRRIGLVHAEVRPGATWKQLQRSRYDIGDAIHDWSDTSVASLIWGRQRAFCYRQLASNPPTAKIEADARRWIVRLLRPVPGVDLMIGGHTIMSTREPVRFGAHLFIDTGAYEKPDGRLTAVDPAAGVYWQVGHHENQQWGPLPLPAPFEVDLPRPAATRRLPE
jgi:serine/threonine protein phosphatase 1